MTEERGETSTGHGAKVGKAQGFLGSLKDALRAASREEAASNEPVALSAEGEVKKIEVIALPPPASTQLKDITPPQSPSAAEAARMARAPQPPRVPVNLEETPVTEAPPTTRVIRAETPKADRTQLVRGRQVIERGTFERDPVVGFLVVVGGPGLGAFRPVFEGNNAIGRAAKSRIPLDFGDEAISNEEQAYIRYDSNDRSFLFVPNLAKTNVVSVNDKRPTGALELNAMDVITLGRTQVAFVPFCGTDFDWSEIADA